MTRTWKTLIAGALCAFYSQGWARAPEFAILDLRRRITLPALTYVADTSRLVTAPDPMAATVRNFMQLLVIADIVPVNGKRPKAPRFRNTAHSSGSKSIAGPGNS